MEITFWGVRGSIPVPGASTLKFGGNTTCIEVNTDTGELIILDAGSGIFQLAQSLMQRLPVQANIFISHTHWDHIHGLPFFTPLFIPGNKINIHGAYDLVTAQGIEHALTVQLQYSYFPIREAELTANIEYFTLNHGQTTTIGETRVTSFLLNHPVPNFGYRIENNGKSIFFTGDHEPPYNIYTPGDELYEEYDQVITEKNQATLDAIRGVDLFIADSSYTREEYPNKIGWGHGTFDTSISMAHGAGVKKLICTHHEPTRDDRSLEHEFQKVLKRQPSDAPDLDIQLAYESMKIKI